MDLGEFRSVISDSGVDVWTWIDMAISVASADHESELKNRRDEIIQKLYAPEFSKCQNCDRHFSQETIQKCGRNENIQEKRDVGFDCNPEEMQLGKKVTENNDDVDKSDDDDYEQRKILEIKILLEDQYQSERCLIDLLQRLVDMDTTFKTLKETGIGRHVTKLRKHPSNEIRRLVKILVRKWKNAVDEWVRLNTPIEEEATQFNDMKSPNEAHHNSIHKGVKTEVIHHTDSQITSGSCYSTPLKRKVKHNEVETDELGSAGKHLHDQNHKETQHAKKRRTEHVMDFHDIPKLKNPIVSNNGGCVPVKYW